MKLSEIWQVLGEMTTEEAVAFLIENDKPAKKKQIFRSRAHRHATMLYRRKLRLANRRELRH